MAVHQTKTKNLNTKTNEKEHYISKTENLASIFHLDMAQKSSCQYRQYW